MKVILSSRPALSLKEKWQKYINRAYNSNRLQYLNVCVNIDTLKSVFHLFPDKGLIRLHATALQLGQC